jgi:hypothetical protein
LEKGKITVGVSIRTLFGEMILRESVSMVELQAQNCVKPNS